MTLDENYTAFSFLDKNRDRGETSISQIFNDTGNGRCSRGMLFLELLSSVFSKKDDELLSFLREHIPVNLDIAFEDHLSDEQKASFIISCLSCENLAKKLKTLKQDSRCPQIRLLDDIMVEIFDTVVSGEFKRNKYKHLMPLIKRQILLIKGCEI